MTNIQRIISEGKSLALYRLVASGFNIIQSAKLLGIDKLRPTDLSKLVEYEIKKNYRYTPPVPTETASKKESYLDLYKEAETEYYTINVMSKV